jgi:hypothetical protein
MKKGGWIIFAAIGLLLLVPLVSASFFDWITGKVGTQPTDVNITVGNTAPLILNVTVTVGDNGIPLEGTTLPITIIVTVFDHDNSTDLVDSTLYVNLTKTNEQVRWGKYGTECSIAQSYGKYRTYTCTILTYYYDAQGVWSINATIQDLSVAQAENDTAIFTLGALTAITIDQNVTIWPLIYPGNTSVKASNDPTVINNTGNDIKNITLTAKDLAGDIDNIITIMSQDFNVSGTLDDECNRVQLINATAVFVRDSLGAKITLSKGNLSAGGGIAQQKIYYCLTYANETLTKQSYTTTLNGPWNIIAAAS